jgi:hypothetical protein
MNDVLSTYWPCMPSIIFAILLIPLTFGLSLLIPMCCISDLFDVLDEVITSANDTIFEPRGLVLERKRKCFSYYF